MNSNTAHTPKKQYLSATGAWALAFGCSVGWGAFVMPGTTFLPIAGPVGTAVGICLGALVMVIIARNYHYLINRYPHDGGGAYTYIKNIFGYDQGFLASWFLILTYIAVIWANATAIPLIARTLLGSTFQFGFHYEIAGFDVYFGEILIVIFSLLIGALVCLRRKAAAVSQIVMAVTLFAVVIICFVVAEVKSGGTAALKPAFSAAHSKAGGTFTIFALAPWAFVGFESISHSSGEAKFPLKRSFKIMVAALFTATVAYVALSLIAVTALPEGTDSWVEYIANLGKYTGVRSQPVFFAAHRALGTVGSVLLGVGALCAIFTGIVGNYIALSRLMTGMSNDGLMYGKLGKLDKNGVPRNAIWCIFFVSFILPFFGRTAISWIVDVTTVGATIAFAFTSAAAGREAMKEKNKPAAVCGIIGFIISLLFALEFLVPNITSVKTLSTESYLILAAWAILGFVVFLCLLKKDKERKLGRSTIAWIVLLGLVIFTSSVWLRQTISKTIDSAVAQGNLTQTGVVQKSLDTVENNLLAAILIQVALIVTALIILFTIYAVIQKREKQTEIEKFLAEESSRAKTSFLSNMSHEIRTPMNAIIGLDNIALRDPELKPKTREHLEKIGASAKHLLDLINDILDMSRIESGRMVLKNEEFSFHDFLEQVNIIINGQCEDKGLQYECNIVGGLNDYYTGDVMKLKQVLINILGNSVKFTEAPGKVSLTVSSSEVSDTQYRLFFKMQDTGIGMDEAFIPQLFEAFSQEDATTTNKYGGSGLGMAITKNLVEMMNGEIKVESRKGVGSTFTVSVVLEKSERTYQSDHGIRLPENLRALVVDDDEIACEHARLVLNTLGVQTEAVKSPKEATGLLQSAAEKGTDYDLVLTDYKMPQMDGLELTRFIRRLSGNKTIVIMLTGYNWDLIEEDAEREGVDMMMAKPLFADDLLRGILSALEKRGTEGIAAREAPPAQEAQNALAGVRVLIAEDIDANAEILADILELEEIESERAENGKVAVEMFSAHPAGYYRAVLMDVRMPEMDGLEATKTIRALERDDARAIPIIAMTANVFDEDVERSRAAGMNAHLSKPVEPEHLYQTLAELINKSENNR